MLLKSYTNELRLGLSSGQAWNLYYRDKHNRITFFDPNNINQSFVVGISGDLYSELSKRLVTHGGSAIALDGSCRIPEMAGK
ncbi:MAG: hypothetical protein OEY53_09835 [Gammaproteobacteria bacterium]|nr:hypothetical protein [Gammaproteobacteria bacterium]